jgi:hypothetical protein
MGLQLTSFTFHYKHLQLVRCCLLKNSSDPVVRGAYKVRAGREESFTHVWSAARNLETMGHLLEHKQRFGGQKDRVGLGAGRYVASPSFKETRKLLVDVLLAESERSLVDHASGLERQGVWTHWNGVRPFDLSWKNLLYGPGPRLLGFVLNSLINSVRTPDMLFLWGYTATADCPLCVERKCTMPRFSELRVSLQLEARLGVMQHRHSLAGSPEAAQRVRCFPRLLAGSRFSIGFRSLGCNAPP